MRTVSDAFKNAVTAYGRQTKIVVTVGGKAFTGKEIVSVRHAFKGSLLRSVMREMDIELEGVSETVPGAELTVTDDGNGNVIISGSAVTVEDDGAGNVTMNVDGASVSYSDGDLSVDTQASIKLEKGTEISSVSVGVKAIGDADYSMCDLGGCVINEVEWDKAMNSVVLKCYDEMLYSMVPYDLSVTYPITLGNYLLAICNRFGWTLGTTSFVNSDVEIEEEKFDTTYTFRDVLDQIAQASASVIGFVDGELCVLYATQTDAVLKADNMISSDGITIGELYGPVTSVVLARTPQEDNIYRIAEGVPFEETVEFKIENNQIMDSHREDFIDGIFNALNGMSFYLYEYHSFGYLYVDLCDIFTLQDQNGNDYNCFMLSNEFTVGQGIDEISSGVRPDETETDYSAASESDRVLNQTILRVDKQEQEIIGLVTRTNELGTETGALKTEMTEVKQTAEKVQITVTQITQNGVDKVKTSMGYSFDNEGMKVAKEGEQINNLIDNTGMYVKDGNTVVLSASNTGVDAINIKVNQYLVVGLHTRFEDFVNENGEERTGCFWL